jgi:hypothetical protein
VASHHPLLVHALREEFDRSLKDVYYPASNL